MRTDPHKSGIDIGGGLGGRLVPEAGLLQSDVGPGRLLALELDIRIRHRPLVLCIELELSRLPLEL